jgi:23S rRNA C2498 (ribose-2'-O)-methylase RlmM
MSDLIPAELRQFLVGNIDSIAQLEALLLLRAAPGTLWTAQEAAKRLYITEQDAAAILTQMAAQGLLTREADGFRFAPQSDDLSRMVDLLAEHYRRHLIAITNLIHAKPRRIRQFADAFKLKKD